MGNEEFNISPRSNLSYLLSPIGAAVVDNDNFVVDVLQVLGQQPDDDGEVLPLIVGRQKYRILVRRHLKNTF